MTKELKLSPAGTFKFLAVKTKAKAYDKTKPDAYTAKLVLNDSDAEAAAFKEWVMGINARLITTNGLAAGEFAISAKSQFEPSVLDANGDTLVGDDIPNVGAGSVAHGYMVVSPFKTENGGGLNLVSVGITDITVNENAEVKGPTQKDLALEMIRNRLATN